MTTTTPSIRDRIAALDWAPMTKDLDSFGCTIVKSVLTREECRSLAALYQRDDIFRSTIVMARHGFGRGEYKYWSYPLPEIVAGLRSALYPPLAAVANRWNQSMKVDVRYPETHEEYLERCHAASQTRPTPLLLSYNESDWNALHQDVYGQNVFPIQVAFLLSEPGKDFTGGEFVLTTTANNQGSDEFIPVRAHPEPAAVRWDRQLLWSHSDAPRCAGLSRSSAHHDPLEKR
ncbi:MAG TPA: 2OG-Fe(II) oxygenase [Candidatus Acidoferrum sp.]|nr:2OG-Fe(II) oxygenase [Candidatus Acidoferrum sp.]